MCAFNICLFIYAFIIGTRLGFINFTIMKMNNWKYIVWVSDVDDYYTTYERAKEHYNEWIEKEKKQKEFLHRGLG